MKKISIACLVIAVGFGCIIGFNSCKKECKLTTDQVEELWTQNASSTIINPMAYEELRQLYIESGDTTESTSFEEYLTDFLNENYPGQKIDVEKPSGPNKLPTKAVVYIDNTSSMKGYLTPADKNVSVADFVNVVNAINDYYSDKESKAMFVSKKGMQETTIDELVSNLKGKKLQTYDAYPMNEFIENIVVESLSDTAWNRVNFFITDAIPSGSNSQIQQDPDFNKNSASVLETSIKAPLRDKGLKDRGYGVSVYKFNGKFDGPYINYTNNRKGKVNVLKNSDRPFYVIAIGNAKELKDFAAKADKEELRNFQPINSLQSFTAVSTLSPTLVVPGNDEGVINPDGNAFTFSSDKAHPSMTVNLPLNQFPEYMRTEKDINRCLVVKVDGKDIFSSNPGQIKISGETVTFPLNFTGDNKTMTMELSVRNELPEWVETTTSRDDIDITSPDQINKTFNLDIVVRGLLDGVFNRKTKTLGIPSVYTITYE